MKMNEKNIGKMNDMMMKWLMDGKYDGWNDEKNDGWKMDMVDDMMDGWKWSNEPSIMPSHYWYNI